MGLPKAVRTGRMSSLRKGARKPTRKAVARKAVRRPAARAPARQQLRAAPARAPLKVAAPVAKRPMVGKVVHFYPNINVAIIELKSELRNGDTVSIEGHGRAFKQPVASMQIEHEAVSVAKRGQSIGLKVRQRAKQGDMVFRA